MYYRNKIIFVYLQRVLLQLNTVFKIFKLLYYAI